MKKIGFIVFWILLLFLNVKINATKENLHLKLNEILRLDTNYDLVESNNDNLIVKHDDNQWTISAKAYGQYKLKVYENKKSTQFNVYVFDAIQFNNDNLILNVGERQKIYTIFQPFANINDYKINYTSSNDLIVSVDNGELLAKTEGSAIIQGEFLGVYDTLKVDVVKESNFKFNHATFNIDLNDTKTLPFSIKSGVVEFSSECPDSIEVDSSGNVKAKKEAECFVIGKHNSDIDRIFVKVNSPLKDFNFEQESYQLALNKPQTLNLLPVPNTAKIINPSIVVENTDIIEYKNNQLVPKNVGVTKLMVNVNGIEKEAKVEVYLPLESISIDPNKIEVLAGNRFNINVIKNPYNSNEQLMPIYSTSDPHIIKIDPYGNVTALNPGRAYVFVQHKDFVASSEVLVTKSLDNVMTLVGKISDKKVVFDTRGINHLSQYSLKIPYNDSLVKGIIKVFVPVNAKITDQNFKEIVLDEQYLNKSIMIDFYDEEAEFLSRVTLNNISEIKNIFIHPSLIPSPFDNLKKNVLELNLDYNLKADDVVLLKLYNGNCDGNYYVYKKSSLSNNADLYNQNKIAVDDNCIIRLTALNAGKFYLSSESLLNIIGSLFIGSLILLLTSVVFFGKKYYYQKSNVVKENKKEKENVSINYQSKEIEESSL